MNLLSSRAWEVTHKPTGTALDWRTSLRSCREYVTRGWAQAALDRLLAHERGEHAERDASCRRCS